MRIQRPSLLLIANAVVICCLAGGATSHADDGPEIIRIPESIAKSAKEMKPYAEIVEHTRATIDMVPIPGGEFVMGSPMNEANRGPGESPQHAVTIDPFWMAKYETTWDAFEVWMFDLDIQRRKLKKLEPNSRDKAADEFQISQPTPPYTDMTFGMGKTGYPAISMTQLGAKVFCQWLTTKTGRYYRLPTEAEWEYACRAGTKTAYHFGDSPDKLDDYAWHYENSEEQYQRVGKKKPNPWGLFDMHGNVSEWVLDQYNTEFYKSQPCKPATNPLAIPTELYPRVVRGGSWNDDPEQLRSAARDFSSPRWKKQDPQIPKSIWYHTDADFVGFRIIRPLNEPSKKEKEAKWENSLPKIDRKAGR